MESPVMFNPSFSFLDNGMSAHSAFEPTHQGSNTRNQLQVPRQAFSPFTQQTYPHSYARPQDRHQGSYPSSPPWQLHSRQHQHALPQYGNHYTFGGDRHQPFALGHALQEKTTAETKARLDKKHVEILEQEFQRNQKPSSIIKRELAEQMGHEIARINNWFQNRRAKEKSNRRTAEYAAREATQQSGSSGGALSGPRSPGHPDNSSAEGQPILDNMQRPIMSSAAIGIGEVDFEDDGPLERPQPQVAGSDEAPDVSPQHADDDMQSNSPHSDNDRPTVGVCRDVPSEGETREPRTSDFSHGFDHPALHDINALSRASGNGIDYLEDSEMPTAWFHPLPHAPSDYFGPDGTPLSPLNAGAPIMAAIATQIPSKDAAMKVQQLASPVSMASTSETPPPPPKETQSRFAAKSPHPINIAARRNHQRPAAIGLPASRKSPYSQGPKTGVDFPRCRADNTTPMRRTTSATGLRLPRVSEGLRSPGLYFQRTRSPSYNSSGSPVSPGRADTPVTHNSDEHHALPYGNFNAPLTSRFESSISTPPVTPGLPLGYSGFANPFEQAWAHTGSEQPVATTPSLCSHGGSETDFAGTSSRMPNYMVSQPTTPGFPRPDAFGPGFRFGHGGMSNAPEYTFPDSSSYVDSTLGSSPHEQHTLSKTFQFAQNMMPQDFNHES